MQQEEAEDFVLVTEETHSVREFCEKAFKHAGIKIAWEGEDVNEKGYNKDTGDVIIEIDPRYFRPTEVDLLVGDATKAKEKLGWKPKYTFDELIIDMVESDKKVLAEKEEKINF